MATKALSIRQRKFIQGVLKGRSYARAARDAGYSDSVANCAGRKIAAKPAVRRKIEEGLRQSGMAKNGAIPEAVKPELTSDQRQLVEDFMALDALGQHRLRTALSELARGNLRIGVIWLRHALYEYADKADRA